MSVIEIVLRFLFSVVVYSRVACAVLADDHLVKPVDIALIQSPGA